MGSVHSCCSLACSSKGAVLLVAAANGDLRLAQELLKREPRAALYHSFNDKTSPLLQASARGHFELVQCIVETAVCVEGVDKAKRLCIDHTNSKRQTPLMVACKHGHADCVEYLAQNGADPLVADERRHNTCLHFAVLYGHSDCLDKLLGSFMATSGQQGIQRLVAQHPCIDEDGAQVCFVDCHNGWGLTALHIAVFQGSVNAVRTLLRHGAALDAVITQAKIENSPIRCAVGSNALHIAAVIGNVSMAKVILEAQDTVPGLELRSHLDSAGMRPGDYAARARNPVLGHLLDERLPVTLLRQIWMNYSLEQTMPPRHQTLGAMLQKLKLMFNLEIIAVQRNLAAVAADDDRNGQPLLVTRGKTPSSMRRTMAQVLGGGAFMPGHALELMPGGVAAQQRAVWLRRQDEVTVLLNSVTHLYEQLQVLCKKSEEGAEWPAGSSSHEAVLDFILSTLITPRTVSSVIHAAKKLVCSNVMAVVAAAPNGGPPTASPSEMEVQQGIALLTTALRAVDTCLQAVSHLSNPGALAAAAAAAAQQQQQQTGGLQAQQAMPSTVTIAPPPSFAVPTASVASNNQVPSVGGAAASVAPTTSAHGPSSTPDSSFTAATARGTIGTRVPSFTSSAPTDGASLLLPDLQQQHQPTATSPALAQPAGAAAGSTAGGAGTGQAAQPPLSPSQAIQAILTNGAQSAGTQPGAQLPMAASATALQLQGLAPGLGLPLLSSNWSSQLNSLIAQLQWDIGVQRHRRRRQHAAAAAARAAAAQAAGQDAAAGPAGGSLAASAGVGAATAASAAELLGNEVPGLTPASVAMRGHLAGMAAQLAHYGGGTNWGSISPLPPSRSRWQREMASAGATGAPGATGVPGAPASLQAAVLLADVRRAMVAGMSSDAAPLTPVQTVDALAAASANPSTPPVALHRSSSGLHADAGTGTSAVPGADADLASELPAAGEIMPRADSLLGTGEAAARDRSDSGTATSPGAAATAPGAVAAGAVSGAGAGTGAVVGTGTGTAGKRSSATEQVLLGTLGEMSEDNMSGGEEEHGSLWSDEDSALCSICMDQPVAVQVSGCQHGLCVQCAFQLTVKGRELPSCPFCRQKIPSFEARRVEAVTEAGSGRGKGGIASGVASSAASKAATHTVA